MKLISVMQQSFDNTTLGAEDALNNTSSCAEDTIDLNHALFRGPIRLQRPSPQNTDGFNNLDENSSVSGPPATSYGLSHYPPPPRGTLHRNLSDYNPDDYLSSSTVRFYNEFDNEPSSVTVTDHKSMADDFGCPPRGTSDELHGLQCGTQCSVSCCAMWEAKSYAPAPAALLPPVEPSSGFIRMTRPQLMRTCNNMGSQCTGTEFCGAEACRKNPDRYR